MFNNRVGTFNIKSKFIEQNVTEILQIFAKIIVIKCEYLYFSKSFEYTGLSNFFEIVEEGDKIPTYKFYFEQEKGKTILKECKQIDIDF